MNFRKALVSFMIPISGEHVMLRVGTRTVCGIMPSEKNIKKFNQQMVLL
jgi:hypothetical protein